VQALARLPDETVIDGEMVALDDACQPSFSVLQNSSSTAQLCYYVFDVLVLAGCNVMAEPLSARRELLRRQVLPRLGDPIREAPQFDASLPDLIRASASKAWRDSSPSGSTARMSPASAPAPLLK